MKILIVEDDKQIVEAIRLALDIRWPDAEVAAAHLGEKGVEMAETEKPDVVILDLGLPDISGFQVLKDIRSFSEVPILILTVRAEEADVVKGLEWGADDYLTKPFKHLELLARINALVRRNTSGDVAAPITVGDLAFNPAICNLTQGDKTIDLTRTESIILKDLMENAGRVRSHSQLAEAIWGADYSDATDSIKVYIRRLREKLEDDPNQPRIIINKPGLGYFFARPQ